MQKTKLGGKGYRKENEKYMTEMFLDSLRTLLMNSMHWLGSYRPPKIILQLDLAKMPEAITLKPLTSGI